jgi:GT2 family glycosyltransferase
MTESHPELASPARSPHPRQSPDFPPRLTIILVNYNGKRYLQRCLISISRFAPAGTQVILEDNASSDGSAEEVGSQFPWVQVVRNEKNLGFAGGNNLASRHAQGKFLLLLNVDTELLEPIDPILRWLEQHAAYGALTVNMLNGHRQSESCTGRFPTPLRLALLRKMLVPPSDYGSAGSYDVDWVQGSFLLVRSDLWKRVGGLDEGFFMYAEDVDLCKRIWDTGAKCAYLPGFKYLHWGGFDSSRFPDQVAGLSRYVEKHIHDARGHLCRAVLYAGCLGRTALYAAKGYIGRSERDLMTAKSCWRAFQVLIGK